LYSLVSSAMSFAAATGLICISPPGPILMTEIMRTTYAFLEREELAVFTDTKAFSGFAVADIKQAQDFYGETLGLKTTLTDPDTGLLILHLAGDRDTFVYEKADHQPATYTILNFSVADIDKAVDELISRGVRFETYEGFEQDEKGIARGAPSIAWFKDPSGNILAVLEE
jgi:catechol 2,3-dioxygenase-like lactoylglutathione lyase family enzyme